MATRQSGTAPLWSHHELTDEAMNMTDLLGRRNAVIR